MQIRLVNPYIGMNDMETHMDSHVGSCLDLPSPQREIIKITILYIILEFLYGFPAWETSVRDCTKIFT